MAEPLVIRPSLHGRITYNQGATHDGQDYFGGRRQRPHVLRVSHALDDYLAPPPSHSDHRLLRVKRLTGPPTSQAKRFIRLIRAPSSPCESGREEAGQTSPEGLVSDAPQRQESEPRGPETQTDNTESALGSMAALDGRRRANGSPRGSVSASNPMTYRPSLVNNVRTESTASTGSARSSSSDGIAIDGAKPVASGNGVAVYVTLAEPVIYLSGFENQDPSARSTAMLRGSLLLRITKSAKIKTVSMKFRGRAETEWPEGIPPKRAEFKDVYHIIDHTFSFYDCNMGNSEYHGAHTHIPAKTGEGQTEVDLTNVAHGFEHFRKGGLLETISSARDGRRLSLQNNHTRSFGKGDVQANPAHKGYRTFTPGDYYYNFELPIDSRYPETINVELGTVKYELEAIVERAGAFRANLAGAKEVKLVRAPSGDSLEAVEPIAISRDWEDQLHYDIVISGKSFPLGSQVPIAFKLTPLAKVQCHRVKVFITENIQYFTKDKKVHRMEPTRKLQLFEKRADSPSNSAFPNSSMRIISGGGVAYDDRQRAAQGDENVQRDMNNLLGSLEDEYNVGPTEMEMNVQLPSCYNMPEKDKNQRIHFDTTYSNIQVHHWIKIVMRLSKSDPDNPGKRRHFEISIDSPLNILSCRATQANTSLPSYNSRDDAATHPSEAACGCPGAHTTTRRRGHSGGSARSMPGADPSLSSSSSSANSSTVDLGASIAPPPMAHLAGGRGAAVAPTPPSSLQQSQTSSEHDVVSPAAAISVDSYNATRDNNRPIHLLRQPSFNPPGFDDSDPPPPLVTPPPQYESLVGPGDDPNRGLADYFQRLADEIDDSDDAARWAGRLEIPLTPGGRVNRSMDEVRRWGPIVP